MTEKEKTWVKFTEASAQFAGDTPKWTAATLQPVLGTSLKNDSEGNPPSGQNFKYTWLFNLFGRRNGKGMSVS